MTSISDGESGASVRIKLNAALAVTDAVATDIATAISTHEAAANPHPTYLTQAEGDLLYAVLADAYTAEKARDDVGAALVGAYGVTVTPDDGANTITVARDLYPSGVYAPRYESWLTTFTETFHASGGIGNQQGPWGGRWFSQSTITANRVDGGGGRSAARMRSTSNTHAFGLYAAGVDAVQDADGPSQYRSKLRIRPRANTSAAPDATDDYVIMHGINDTWSNTAHTGGGDYAIFAYYQSGGNAVFEARSRRASGTAEVTTLTAPSADTTYTWEVVVTPSDVKFYVDGSLVATHTTVPDGIVVDGFRCGRIAGTNTRDSFIYWMAASILWSSDV